MYITITAQKLGGQYSQSVANFVDYLEKENEGLQQEEMEHFFNQYGDRNLERPCRNAIRHQHLKIRIPSHAMAKNSTAHKCTIELKPIRIA